MSAGSWYSAGESPMVGTLKGRGLVKIAREPSLALRTLIIKTNGVYVNCDDRSMDYIKQDGIQHKLSRAKPEHYSALTAHVDTVDMNLTQ
jgi:hypothetical protein